jgi:prepilin-type N-terminal cleavage/methylation domain-containing protein
MSRARGNAGFTLIELLLVMTLSLLLLGATLAVFHVLAANTKRNQEQLEAQRDARTAVNVLAVRLRNLANPVASGSATIQGLERAQPQDLIFRSVRSAGPAPSGNAANIQRDRFCLAPGGDLYRQTHTWTAADPGLSPSTTCPGTGWTTQRVVAQHVVNGTRPVFSYLVGSGTVTEQDAVAAGGFAEVSGIRSTLFVDAKPGDAPQETTLATRVFLRNQNRIPTAAFVATCGAGGRVVLNGSDSSDPEAEPLAFQWFDGTTPIGTGATFTTLPLSVGTHAVSLKVTDGGSLSATASAQTATITSTSCAIS